MNEETNTVEVVEDVQEVTAEPQVNPEPQEDKKYTDAEVDAIIAKKFAKWNKEQEAKQAEAEKVRKMNVEQKAEYEKQKQADRIAELEAQLNRRDLEREASSILAEKGIQATADVLDFVVRSNAEETFEAINSFNTLVEQVADLKVSEMLKGKTPSRIETTSQGLTQADFDKMTVSQRSDLFNTNRELYDQFTKKG